MYVFFRHLLPQAILSLQLSGASVTLDPKVRTSATNF